VWPVDLYWPHIPTHSLVGQRHWEIFGTHFPPLLGNGWSDDWIDAVYAPLGRSRRVDAVHVRHAGLPMRYNVTASKALYERQVAIDREVLGASLSSP
jgi:hypothetical protein